MKPYDFASAPNLPPALAARMQKVADSRAAAGLISPDGQTHISAECRDLYNAGHGLLSATYMDARSREYQRRETARMRAQR